MHHQGSNGSLKSLKSLKNSKRFSSPWISLNFVKICNILEISLKFGSWIKFWHLYMKFNKINKMGGLWRLEGRCFQSLRNSPIILEKSWKNPWNFVSQFCGNPVTWDYWLQTVYITEAMIVKAICTLGFSTSCRK